MADAPKTNSVPPDVRSNYQLFYESAPVAFVVLAPDPPRFTILAASDAYLRATRTSRDIIGRGIFDVFPDDPRDPASTGGPARASFERVLATGAPDAMAVQKHSVLRPEAEGGGFEEKYWSPINTPVLGSRGEVLFIHHRVEDVTEFVRLENLRDSGTVVAEMRTRAATMEADILRRARELQEANQQLRIANERLRAAEPLLESERRLRALADSMPQLAWTAQPDGYITWYNRRWYEFTGTTPEQMKGWGWQDVHDPEALPAVIERWKESIATGAAFEMEFPLRGADGRFRRFLTRVSPLKDSAGNVLQWFGTNTDITALAEAQAALQDAARRKDEFLGMLSHELRNPLAPIRNSTYILRHAQPGGEQARRAQSVIERQIEHLTRLVDDLLDITRIARGKIGLRLESVDLREVVLRAAEDHRLALEDAGVAFRTELCDAPLRVDADATRVVQTVGNLLHNASKFTRRGDEVVLSVTAVAATAVIRVRDTGMGIDPALLPRVFEPFVQADQSLARTQGGLGLGLALVKAIAELHGGSARATSAGKGKGAEFVVTLPLVTKLTSQQLQDDEVRSAEGRRRVLVVDDNRDAAESLAAIVAMLGHTAAVAYDGPGAIAYVREHSPDVVLCDIGLPGMSGYEVARALRALGCGAQLFAVSGYAQPEDVKRAVEAGFDGHVAKPPDIARIERLLA